MSDIRVDLTVIEGHGKGKSFTFTEPENFLLGRNAKDCRAHFRLSPEDTFVSRNHFLLEINPPDCFIRDAGSLNGTFILRQDKKTIFYFTGRGEDERQFRLRAEKLQKELGFTNSQKINERLPLQDKDLIKVGKTIISVSVTKGKKDQKAYQISPDQLKGEKFQCIECNKKINRKINQNDARKLSSKDYVCDDCQKKYAEIRGPKENYLCIQCRKDVTAIADKDKKAVEFRDVAVYFCENCMNSYIQDNPTSSIGGYNILSEIGCGGFSTVYLVRHNVTGRLAALKLTKETVKMDAALIQRFKREIAIMKKLKHPNLVRLYDEGITDAGNYFLVSEYLAKGNLSNYCFSYHNGKMPYQIACNLMAQALEGLSYFHENKYVHRDIKPENILLLKDGKGIHHAKVADFGLARSYILHGGTITRANEWIGTAFYCPPEQILDFKNAHPASDVYAMGMTLYFILSGEFPYDFPVRQDTANRKGQKDPIAFILGDDKPVPIENKITGIPSKIAAVIGKAIEKDIQKRLQTVQEFKKVLEVYAK